MAARVGQRQIEELTRQAGQELFDRMRAAGPLPLHPQWWEQKLMGVFMRDEWLKVQAFRLIDALPMLGADEELARHLKEYLVHPADARRASAPGRGDARRQRAQALAELSAPAGGALPGFVSRLVDFERVDSARARWLARLVRRGALLMARRFIAGASVQEAERALLGMRAAELGFTVDVLGEAALSPAEAERYQQVYLELLRELPRQARGWPKVPLIDEADGVALPRVNVSVKLTALCPGLDAIDPARALRAAKERLRPLLRQAQAGGAHLQVDMEHWEIKELTLAICRELFCERQFRDYPHFGLVLQAYLKEADRDAAETLDWLRRRGVPLWVRLVKGAYWDCETVWAAQAGRACPVWEQKWQTDACFERLTRLLLENHRHVHTALASHNIRSLAHGLALRRLLDVPPAAFELQMLYGMGDAIKRAAVQLRQRCRVYTPYGQILPGMAYFIRRLLENTANESFLRHSLDEETPEDELLLKPEQAGRRAPPPRLRCEPEEPVMDAFDNAADTDFTREPGRQQMLSGLAQVRAELGRAYPLIIGQERVTTGTWRDALNPARPAEVVGRVAQADAAHVEQALKVAAGAFADWRRLPAHERAEYLFAAARIMARRRYELAGLAVLECGKPWREADADVSEAIDYCNYYGRQMMRMAAHVRRRDIPGQRNEYFYVPRGVAAVISTWSFPLAIPAGQLAAALVTGNTVVFKPASAAGCVGSELVEVFGQAGLPAGVLNYLPGPGATVGAALVQHPRVALVAFTGSRAVGAHIHRLAAQTTTAQPAIRKVIAEMGGKNAIIVDSDADLDEAIKGVSQSAFAYAGQKCTAASRAIVLAPVYERFVERLVAVMRTASVGPAEEPGTLIPPVIDAAAMESIRRYIAIGKSEARCALEVDTARQIAESGGGCYVGPVIFVDVPPQARIAREEIFGPVLAVIRAPDIAAAIRIFNDCDYALTGGIYSRSPANIERARRECECGNLYINRRITGSRVDLQPYGGFKMSGMGARVGGPDYLLEFCVPRTVSENTLRHGFAPREEVTEQFV